MKTDAQLFEEIEEMKKEHSFKKEINEKLSGIDHIAFLHKIYDTTKMIVVTCKNENEFKFVHNLFPITKNTHTVGNDNKVINSPYRININNPAIQTKFNGFSVNVKWVSNEIGVECKLPIELAKEFIFPEKRRLSDCEYHYFTNCTDLHQMKVRSYCFKKNQIKWYGGSVTLIDAEEIKNIITHLLK